MEHEFTVYLTMQVSVKAESAKEAEENAHGEAAAKLESRGIGALTIESVERDDVEA